MPSGTIKVAFANNYNLTSVKLPKSLKILERGVFYACTALKSIEMPEHVVSIGEYTFNHCDSLRDIYNLSPTPQEITVIHHKPSQITLHVPTESFEEYKNAPFWNQMKIVGIN